MLQHEEVGKRPIVLCSRSDIENPLPGEIGFVKVTSYTDALEMANANVADASCIIVDNQQDDITLSAALYCANINPNAHLLAYFKDDALGQLLSQHCPKAECIPAVDLAQTNVDALFSFLKKHHQATLIAVDVGQGIELNPHLDRKVPSGAKLFYIADERIHSFEWEAIKEN